MVDAGGGGARRSPDDARRRAFVTGALAVLLLAGCNAGGSIVPPNEGFAIKVNLLCTTCDDFLDCRRDGAPPAPPAPGAREPLLVYRLKEKGFWAQVATIGDYLFQFFRQKQTDERPLAIYRDDGLRRSIEQLPTRAFIDGVAGTITLPDSIVDMRSGAWLDTRGESIGRCRALVRRDGYALMRQFLGRAPAPGAAPAVAPAPAPAPALAPAAGAPPQ
jgi:hypothetical protein